MADASKRAATLTTLVIEQVKVGVGLFTTVAKPGGLATFETAGPNGGVLLQQEAAHEKPLSSSEPMAEVTPQHGFDPLAADPGSEAPPIEDGGSTQRAADAGLTPGEFRKVLVEQGTGQVVNPDEVRRGIRLDDGSFMDCTGRLKAIEEETKLEQMTVVKFIDVGQVERARVLASYYIGASEPKGAKPLHLIYEAMKARRRVAVVKWSNRSRQSLGVLVPHGKSETLMLLKLAWAEDWREAPSKAVSIMRAGVTDAEVEMAGKLIDAMSDTVDSLDELRDDAIVLREDLHAEALAGEVEPFEPPPAVEEEIALEDAFEASLALVGNRAGKG